MEKDKYIQDLKEIKDLMNKSSRFISLSGWSGVSIGVLALIASYIAFHKIEDYDTNIDLSIDLFKLAIFTLFGSLAIGFIFTYNKSKRLGQKIWTSQTKLLLWNLFLPLAVGGILCIILLLQGSYGSISSYTLIFYGLALINASKYTLSSIRGLGIINCVLGLLGTYFVGHGLLLWAMGFGVFHIVYGFIMMIKSK